jgi:hypothetical protein
MTHSNGRPPLLCLLLLLLLLAVALLLPQLLLQPLSFELRKGEPRAPFICKNLRVLSVFDEASDARVHGVNDILVWVITGLGYEDVFCSELLALHEGDYDAEGLSA